MLKLIVEQHPHLVRPVPLPAPAAGASVAAADTSEPVDDASTVATATAAAASAATTASSMQQVLDALKERLRNLGLEGLVVEVELPVSGQAGSGGKGGSGGPFSIDLGSLGGTIGGQSGGTMAINLERLMGSRKEKKKMTVAEARTVLGDGEAERMFPADVIAKEAVRLTESDGIVFIDEIDKVRGLLDTLLSVIKAWLHLVLIRPKCTQIVAGRDAAWRGGDPSSEGVQRDLLPIIEGSMVSTKHGNVNTDHILFICSGAFHSCAPSDLMAELQGRLPIRVELKALSRKDFYRILTEPQFNLIKQQQVGN